MSDSRVSVVREALEKIQAQGAIGTVDIARCIAYLKGVEADIKAREDAIERFKINVLSLD